MPKDKKRILITLTCRLCERNLENDNMIIVHPQKGSAECFEPCSSKKVK